MTWENDTLLANLLQAFNNGDLRLIDQIVAPDFLGYHPLIPDHIRGQRGLKAFFAALRKAMPDACHPSWMMISEGEFVAVHAPLEGIFARELMGIPPTGKKVVLWTANIWRIVDGRIVEAWFTLDTLGLMPQLGVIPFVTDLRTSAKQNAVR